MPITLDPECRSRLIAILESALPQVIVDHGRFVNSNSLSVLHDGNKALPTRIREQLVESISDNPFSTFVYGVLSAKVMREFAYQSGTKEKLTDLPGYQDVAVLSRDLLTALESLPWTYTLLFPLSLKAYEDSSDFSREYPLTDTASLIAPGPEFSREFPVLPAEESLSFYSFDRDAGPRVWRQNSYYLKLVSTGFIEDFVLTRPIEEATLFIRSLCGVLMSSGLVRPRSTYSLVPTESPFFTYRMTESGNQNLRSHMLRSEYSEKILSLEWIELHDAYGPRWAGWMNYFQRRLQPALTASHEKNSVRRAAQWYFDSECGSNELLQFVQATVALEILLGDKSSSDVVGIAELLANRCAYLLAEDHEDRARMLREVKDLYDTRSAIVHRGKHRLTKVESLQLLRLQSYCVRVIQKELDLLSKSTGVKAGE